MNKAGEGPDEVGTSSIHTSSAWRLLISFPRQKEAIDSSTINTFRTAQKSVVSVTRSAIARTIETVRGSFCVGGLAVCERMCLVAVTRGAVVGEGMLVNLYWELIAAAATPIVFRARSFSS
jgi:hypothetical protein